MPTTATLNAKINEVKSEIPRVTNLATTASDLVKKADYDAKMSEIEKIYFPTFNCNKFMNNTHDAKIKQKKVS